MSYPATEKVSFYLEEDLYNEVFECEVEPYNLETDLLLSSQIQFIQGMLNAEDLGDYRVFVDMTRDGVEYFLRVVLPETMEMWSVWGSDKGQNLLYSARCLLKEFGISCPY